MPDELPLRERARDAIKQGRLPIKKPDRTYGGPGTGQLCAVCQERMPRGQAVLEIEFHRIGTDPGGHCYFVHPRCFAAWEFERTNIEGGSI